MTTINLTPNKSTYILTLPDNVYINTLTLEGQGCVYLNSLKIENVIEDEESYTTKDLSDKKISGIIQIFIDPYKNYNDLYIQIHTSDESNVYEINYKGNKSDKDNYFYKHITHINNDRVSFMLLRTNPKLTGNIKVVVDEKEDLFLDTFQVSEILSKEKYRHIPISGKNMFCNDVRNAFKDIPKNELYKVSDNNYDLFSVRNELHEQYIDTYFYGVKNNYDKLYSENFALLAPLYINNILPDYFLVFRVDNAIDINSSKEEDIDKFKKIISNGKLIKSFDLRENSELGNYLRNIQKDITQYPTSIYLSMNQYNHNEWTGISVDRGVITTATESGYLLSQVKNQVDYDRYVTNGFERNGLISSRLLNIEFMFNDLESEDFKINRYFGLYVYNHHIKDIYNYTEESDRYYFADILEDKSIIINLTTDFDDIPLKKLTNEVNIEEAIKEVQERKPIENLLSTNVNYANLSNTSFININFNNDIKTGEHFRLIDKSNRKVYEVVSAFGNNDDKFYLKNKNSIVNYYDDITFYRNIIVGDISLEEQMKQLIESFNSILPNDIKLYSYGNDISFVVENNFKNEYYFQRISGKVLYEEDLLKEDKLKSIKSEVTYFGNEIDCININYEKIELDNIFYPIHFETWNNRMTQIIKLVTIPKEDVIYFSKNYIKSEEDLIVECDDDYKDLNKFEISYFNDKGDYIKNNYNTIKSPLHKEMYLFRIGNYNNITIEKIKVYRKNKLKLNIAGLLPIKDFNFAVIDETNYIQSYGNILKLNEGDEYSKDIAHNNMKIKNIRNGISSENFYQYIDITSNDNILEKNNCVKKINNIYNKSKKMDIPLVVPINCKWRVYGKDIFNNEIKSSVFSPQAYSYYLQISNKNYNIFAHDLSSKYELTSLIKNGDEYLTIRDYILKDNGNIYDIIDEKYFSKVYFNNAINKLEVIFSGQKMQLGDDTVDLSNYDGYMFSIIKSKSVNIHSKNIEIVIDENNKVIVCIWYVGNYYNNNWIKTNSISNLSEIYNNKSIPFINCDDISKLSNKDVFISMLSDKDKNYTYNFKIDKSNEYVLFPTDDFSMSYEDDFINEKISEISRVNDNTSVVYIRNVDNKINVSNNITSFKNVFENVVINCFIKRENEILDTKDNFKITFIEPVDVRKDLPIKILNNLEGIPYFTYSGYIQPEMKNIFEFANLNDGISEKTGVKFVGGNIAVNKINKINQLWFNKVSEEKNYPYKEDENALISIDVKKNFSVFSNCWGEKFYTKYYRSKKCKNEFGYKAKRSVKTFFESQGMVINSESIIIDDWSNNYTVTSNENKKYSERNSPISNTNKIITLNVTNAILDNLKIKTNILNNWCFDSKAINYSDDYINNIIDSVYNINLNNNIEIYRSKVNSNSINVVDYSSNYFDKLDNVKMELIKNDNKYLLRINIPNSNYNYAIKYTISK